MEYEIGTTVLGDWKITKLLGEGANGKVYEIQKSEYGITTKSALKIIRVPQSDEKCSLFSSDKNAPFSWERYYAEKSGRR